LSLKQTVTVALASDDVIEEYCINIIFHGHPHKNRGKNMIKKILVLTLIGLFLSIPIARTQNGGTYNPSADVNHDGTVDIQDLATVGQAYGTNLTLPYQTNKTVITVLSYQNGDNSPVQNAMVKVYLTFTGTSLGLSCATNSSGIAIFDLKANTNYTALVWSSDLSSYNYANFTTNSAGEASEIIWLGNQEDSPNIIQTLPDGWFIALFVNRTTGNLITSFNPGVNWIILDSYLNSTNNTWIHLGYMSCETNGGGIAADSTMNYYSGGPIWDDKWGPGVTFNAYDIRYHHWVAFTVDPCGGAYVLFMI
jgi:hypothetical protein